MKVCKDAGFDRMIGEAARVKFIFGDLDCKCEGKTCTWTAYARALPLEGCTLTPAELTKLSGALHAGVVTFTRPIADVEEFFDVVAARKWELKEIDYRVIKDGEVLAVDHMQIGFWDRLRFRIFAMSITNLKKLSKKLAKA